MAYSFSDRINKIMAMKGIKQADLGKKSHRSQSTIHRTLHSSTIPRYDTLTNITKALDVPVEALTHQCDTVAEIIIELSLMSKADQESVLADIKKEKLWRSRSLPSQ